MRLVKAVSSSSRTAPKVKLTPCSTGAPGWQPCQRLQLLAPRQVPRLPQRGHVLRWARRGASWHCWTGGCRLPWAAGTGCAPRRPPLPGLSSSRGTPSTRVGPLAGQPADAGVPHFRCSGKWMRLQHHRVLPHQGASSAGQPAQHDSQSELATCSDVRVMLPQAERCLLAEPSGEAVDHLRVGRAEWSDAAEQLSHLAGPPATPGSSSSVNQLEWCCEAVCCRWCSGCHAGLTKAALLTAPLPVSRWHAANTSLAGFCIPAPASGHGQ